MARLLVFPFRLAPDGSLVTADAGSDPHVLSSVHQHVGTVIGERIMCWPFGVPDPAFRGLVTDDVQASLDRFSAGGVRVTAVTAPAAGETSDVTVTWERVNL